MLSNILLLIGAALNGIGGPTDFHDDALQAASGDQGFITTAVTPIEVVAREGRELRRYRPHSFVPIELPAIEIERHRDRTVTLLLIWRSRPAERHKIPETIWRELTALDHVVFARQTHEPFPVQKDVSRVVACHGESADFEAATAGRVRTVSASECFSVIERLDAARLAAIGIFVKAAATTRPGCTYDGSKLASILMKCFPPTVTD